MARTKHITKRPIVIVNLSTSKWGVAQRSDTKEYVLVNYDKCTEKEDDVTNYKIVNVKDDTKTVGTFYAFSDSSCYNYILPSGKTKRYYEVYRSGENCSYNSLDEAIEALKKAKKNQNISMPMIMRKKETYFNPQTKEVTSDKSVAKTWFKGKDPLFISTCPYQRIGMWVEPVDKESVEVSLYYIDRIQREGCDTWHKVKEGGFRLYKDGTISHFYKGKYRDTNRIFCTDRVNYRTFDVRFRGQYRLSSLYMDLRSPELIGSDNECRGLSQETLDILQECGFPKDYWCWGNTKRLFEDTYDLVNFATHIQNKNQTKRGSSMEEFLADKPFVLGCETIVPFNKGVIIRVPGFREVWRDAKGRTFEYKPFYYDSEDKCTLLKAEVYEKYRIWISNNGKTRACQELIHDNTCWSQCRWDCIGWPSPKERLNEDTQHPVIRKALKDYKQMSADGFYKLYDVLPILQRFKEFATQHPEMKHGYSIRSLLDAIYRAPRFTETMIKLGYESWFFERATRYYNGREEKIFDLDNALCRFGLTDTSYEEKTGKSLYQNLGISKEQFKWLATYKNAGEFMSHFRNILITIPGKTENYASFADVPVKYLQLIARLVDAMTGNDIDRSWSYYQKVQDLLSRYHLTPLDLQKIIDKQFNFVTYCDYLRLREQCSGAPNFNVADWDKIPADANDLRFSHDRLCAFYNLMQAERERYWREREEQNMIERQQNYDARFKKLKSLAYSEEDNDRVIIVPKKLIELVVEGQILHHCVGSFAQSVSEGRDTIVFLRDKKTPNVPYATISLLKHGDSWVIDQAHTAHNGPITADDVEFLKRWGIKNKVDKNSITTHYGLHCHH